MAQAIKFGTDGWRAVIADDFTFDNLRRVALATARHFRRHKKIRNGIVVGYDARFMSREFAEVTAETIANQGIRVLLADSIVSTPMVSLMTKQENAAAGIVITASHNPAKWNGYKIKGDFGGPAHPEMVARVEKELARVLALKRLPGGEVPLGKLLNKKKVTLVNMRDRYVEDLRTKVDVARIRSSGVRMLFDAMHGSGMGVMGQLLPGVVQMRGEFNPSFGGSNPEPLAHNLKELARRVPAEGFGIGIATDGDADRVGAVDGTGAFVDSHRIFSLLLKYFVEQKGMTGEVAKSFSVTTMVDEQCRRYGITMHETPVGFKHLARLMTERDILIAGEESGGLGVKGHLPERDGILLGLLLCEMMAVRGMSLADLVEELFGEFGRRVFKRVDLHITEKEKQAIMRRVLKGLKEIAGRPVIGRMDTDGVKYFVDQGWVLVRASGTEPLVRFYAEAESDATVDAMLGALTGTR
ncbi:MAG: Phosphoglucosamine mutase [Bacteroidetes bacterium]|nr:Phosphoglucosamine mutase [Bacteroidota bacterium]